MRRQMLARIGRVFRCRPWHLLLNGSGKAGTAPILTCRKYVFMGEHIRGYAAANAYNDAQTGAGLVSRGTLCQTIAWSCLHLV
jgi:hypothetical protein